MSNDQLKRISGSTAVAVVPSDSVTQAFSKIYVGGAGNVKITDSVGNVSTFIAVPVGQYIEVRTRLVWATGTTATNLVGIG